MKIKFFTLALLLCSALLKAQSSLVVDISTGVVNGTVPRALITPGTNDDTYLVKVPGGTSFQSAGVSNNYAYGSGPYSWHYDVTGFHNTNDCANNYISPYTSTTPGPTYGYIMDHIGAATPCPVGYYQYKMTFNGKNCNVTGATLNVHAAGVDNAADSVSINGHMHDLTPYNIDYLVDTLASFSLPIPAGEIVSGVNSVIFYVYNASGPTCFLVCGDMTINYAGDSNLIPSITGGTNFCAGQALTFTGSDGPSTAVSTYWEITECNASGVPASGGFSWSNWYPGAPGSFTFSSGLGIACGKYYKVKLALYNQCVDWVETSKVILINCNPTANAGIDDTICSGSCITIGTTGRTGSSIVYQWTSPQGTIGTGQTVNVCPPSATTYTYTVTNTATGCSATDNVTITVDYNPATFSLASNINPGDNFYTLFATPYLNVSGIGGYGYAWVVDEIVSPTNGTLIKQVYNSSCWWNSALTTNFNGYDGPYYTSTGLDPMAGGCSSPSEGHFTAGHTYRIVRGTWSYACPWQQHAEIAYKAHGLVGDVIVITEDPNAPDYSGLVLGTQVATSVSDLAVENIVSVYPNPGKGVFSIEMNNSSKASIEIYDALGKKVKSFEHSGFKSTVDLTGYPKGIYMINIISEGKKISKKIVLE